MLLPLLGGGGGSRDNAAGAITPPPAVKRTYARRTKNQEQEEQVCVSPFPVVALGAAADVNGSKKTRTVRGGSAYDPTVPLSPGFRRRAMPDGGTRFVKGRGGPCPPADDEPPSPSPSPPPHKKRRRIAATADLEGEAAPPLSPSHVLATLRKRGVWMPVPHPRSSSSLFSPADMGCASFVPYSP